MCNDMMERYGSAKQRTKLCKVYARLMNQKVAPPSTSEKLPGNEFVKDEPYVVEIDPSGLIEFGGRWLPWKNILFGAVVVVSVLVFIVVLPFMLPKDEEGVVEGANIILRVMRLLLQYMLSCVVFYVSLWTSNKLLHGDTLLDTIDACIFAPIFGILACIPIIGWGIAYFVLAERYDMSLWDMLTFTVVFIMVNIAIVFLLLPTVFGQAI